MVGQKKTVIIKTEKKCLDAGDYALKGYEHVCLVERKGSMGELSKNLLSPDRGRFNKAFGLLMETCEEPVLLLDFSIASAMRPNRYCPNPTKTMDALLQLISQKIPSGTSGTCYGKKTRFGVLWSNGSRAHGPRRVLGETIARLMLHHALEYEATIQSRGVDIDQILRDVEQDSGTS